MNRRSIRFLLYWFGWLGFIFLVENIFNAKFIDSLLVTVVMAICVVIISRDNAFGYPQDSEKSD
jgi:hypothetical protein